jgi:hypothetical protein
MKMGRLVLAGIITIMCSCSNTFLSEKSNEALGNTSGPVSMLKSVDAGYYRDITLPQADAREVRKSDILYTCAGSYKNGNATITIDPTRGTIELYAGYSETSGKTFRTIYSFEAKAADKNSLYIRPDVRKTVQVQVNGLTVNSESISDLALCLPLYGYGVNRIEVSSVMDGYALMPAGTYWKSK